MWIPVTVTLDFPASYSIRGASRLYKPSSRFPPEVCGHRLLPRCGSRPSFTARSGPKTYKARPVKAGCRKRFAPIARSCRDADFSGPQHIKQNVILTILCLD